MTLIIFRGGQAQQSQNRWSNIQQTCHAIYARLLQDQAWGREEKRNVDILRVNEEGMAVIAFVLAEGFPVVPEEDEHSIRLQPAPFQPIKQLSQSLVSIMQGIAISSDVFRLGKWP